ncbi:MAG: Gfo/Idh/MocA family oxidoreductase [Lacrimispora sp.]|uniref:Gfo/Idh/MocA family protein n=1 Tax=Lacrimispora sp. TaxID=2719234 RepID=UPI0039E6F6B8
MARLKAAVIGSGFIGAAHVEALKRVSGVDVVALVDIMDPQCKAEELDVPNGFADYREMIEMTKPDCIHICTPNNTHKEIAMYAFEHGVNVICEKPMARNAGEAAEMLTAAKASGLIHAVNLHNRFYPANHQLRNMIQDGVLGKIYGVHGGYLQDCFSQKTDFNWRMLSENGGNTRVTSDIGSHWIDLAEYVTGSKVKEVFAEFQTALPVRKINQAGKLKDVQVDTEDTSYVTVRFDNGAVGNAVFSQVYQGSKNQTTIKVSGSEISAEWDSESISELKLGYRNEPNRLLTKDRTLAHPKTAPIISYPGGHVEGFPDAFKQNFIAIYGAIRGIKPTNPYATFEDGLHQMQVIDKMCESAKTGRWIHVD